jgi:F-type H+-transporting ATPase subunit alpha
MWHWPKASTVAQIIESGKTAGNEYSIVVAAASDPAYAVQGPLAGCAMGEYFRDLQDLIYDLSKQAVAYRQMSLLLRRHSRAEAYRRRILPSLSPFRTCC